MEVKIGVTDSPRELSFNSAQTPTEVEKEINDALKDPAIKTRIEELGGIPFPGSAADFDKFIKAETDKWRPVVQKSGATVD